MDLGLKDARVVVAASSDGLGAATARRFCLEGARVAINGREPVKLENTARSIRDETGGEVIALPGDVTDPAAAQALIEGAAAQFGGLDILVTNAGGPPPGLFETLPLDAWEKTFQVSVMSAVRLIHAALPYLRRSDRAAILAITSFTVKQPAENLILSNSVRMAVAGLVKSLANELGPQGIRVNNILPGWTYTSRVEQIMQTRAKASGSAVEQVVERIVASVPLRRMARPEEFADVAVFLCSPAASYIHGAAIPVDGGLIQMPL